MQYSRGLHRLTRFLLPFAVLFSSMATAAEPKVLVSIKPLELIASAITDGVTKPDLLLQPGTSPHDYNLKPSDIKNLASADVVFWVGENLEGFLKTPLARYSSEAKTVALMHAPDMKIQRFLSAKKEDHDDHHDHNNDHNKTHKTANEEHHSGHAHHHHHGSHDPHVWLSPDNAIAMAKAMAEALSQVDTSHAAVYQTNYRDFAAQVRASDATNKGLLESIHNRGFFVFHDGWGYFTRHYDLKVLDVFTLNPEQQPGARHMVALRHKLKEAGNTCVFREPQFHPAYLGTVVDKLPVKIDVIDPLASDVQAQPDSYPEYLEQLSVTIRDCLSSPHS